MDSQSFEHISYSSWSRKERICRRGEQEARWASHEATWKIWGKKESRRRATKEFLRGRSNTNTKGIMADSWDRGRVGRRWHHPARRWWTEFSRATASERWSSPIWLNGIHTSTLRQSHGCVQCHVWSTQEEDYAAKANILSKWSFEPSPNIYRKCDKWQY